eukprot:scaffold252408_cov14-Prasinocladus_malaysianus.AAC.1
MSKLQKQLQESRSEVETLGMELRASAVRQEVSQRLSNSVINLWNKMHDNSEVRRLACWLSKLSAMYYLLPIHMTGQYRIESYGVFLDITSHNMIQYDV